MNCSNCGAPLPPKTNICGHCSTVNDVDLRHVPGGRRQESGESGRVCPRCEEAFRVVRLVLPKPVDIDQCPTCKGMFFDPKELDAVLDSSITNVYDVDFQRMAIIVEQEAILQPSRVRYIKCPVCTVMMNRKNFGSRSGVVVDTCREHGVWLDGGELAQLIKWARAGGQTLDETRRAAEHEEAKRKARRELRTQRYDVEDALAPTALTRVAVILSRLFR